MNAPLRITTAYRVPYADTDQMRVVYYANYLVYFERARNELLRACGMTYRRLEEEGIALPVVEALVSYRAPAVYDDLLELAGWCEEAKGARLKIRCEVRRGGVLLAEGHTVHACVNLSTLRPVRPPRDFLQALGFARAPRPEA